MDKIRLTKEEKIRKAENKLMRKVSKKTGLGFATVFYAFHFGLIGLLENKKKK